MCNHSRHFCPSSPGEDLNNDGWCKRHSWIEVKRFNSRTRQWEHLGSCSHCELQNRRSSSAKARVKSNREAKEKAKEQRDRQDASTSSGDAYSEKAPWKLHPIVANLLWWFLAVVGVVLCIACLAYVTYHYSFQTIAAYTAPAVCLGLYFCFGDAIAEGSVVLWSNVLLSTLFEHLLTLVSWLFGLPGWAIVAIRVVAYSMLVTVDACYCLAKAQNLSIVGVRPPRRITVYGILLLLTHCSRHLDAKFSGYDGVSSLTNPMMQYSGRGSTSSPTFWPLFESGSPSSQTSGICRPLDSICNDVGSDGRVRWECLESDELVSSTYAIAGNAEDYTADCPLACIDYLCDSIVDCCNDWSDLLGKPPCAECCKDPMIDCSNEWSEDLGDPPYYCFDRFNIVEAWPTLVSERTRREISPMEYSSQYYYTWRFCADFTQRLFQLQEASIKKWQKGNRLLYVLVVPFLAVFRVFFQRGNGNSDAQQKTRFKEGEYVFYSPPGGGPRIKVGIMRIFQNDDGNPTYVIRLPNNRKLLYAREGQLSPGNANMKRNATQRRKREQRKQKEKEDLKRHRINRAQESASYASAPQRPRGKVKHTINKKEWKKRPMFRKRIRRARRMRKLGRVMECVGVASLLFFGIIPILKIVICFMNVSSVANACCQFFSRNALYFNFSSNNPGELPSSVGGLVCLCQLFSEEFNCDERAIVGDAEVSVLDEDEISCADSPASYESVEPEGIVVEHVPLEEDPEFRDTFLNPQNNQRPSGDDNVIMEPVEVPEPQPPQMPQPQLPQARFNADQVRSPLYYDSVQEESEMLDWGFIAVVLPFGDVAKVEYHPLKKMSEVKREIQQRLGGVSLDSFSLLQCGRDYLERTDCTLSDYNIQKNDTLVVLARGLGGKDDENDSSFSAGKSSNVARGQSNSTRGTTAQPTDPSPRDTLNQFTPRAAMGNGAPNAAPMYAHQMQMYAHQMQQQYAYSNAPFCPPPPMQSGLMPTLNGPMPTPHMQQPFNPTPLHYQNQHGPPVPFGILPNMLDQQFNRTTAAEESKDDESSVEEEVLHCSGLRCAKVDQHAQIDKEYCSNEWSDFGGAWRSKDCKYVVPNSQRRQERDGWTQVSGYWHCSACAKARKNINRHYRAMEQNQTNTSVSDGLLPPTSTLKDNIAAVFQSKLRECNGNLKEAVEAFQKDSTVLDALIVLARKSEADITIELNQGTYRIYLCGSDDCEQILVKQQRESNAFYCNVCDQKHRNAERAEATREAKHHSMVAANSRTKFSALPPDMQNERLQNRRIEVGIQRRN